MPSSVSPSSGSVPAVPEIAMSPRTATVQVVRENSPPVDCDLLERDKLRTDLPFSIEVRKKLHGFLMSDDAWSRTLADASKGSDSAVWYWSCVLAWAPIRAVEYCSNACVSAAVYTCATERLAKAYEVRLALCCADCFRQRAVEIVKAGAIGGKDVDMEMEYLRRDFAQYLETFTRAGQMEVFARTVYHMQKKNAPFGPTGTQLRLPRAETPSYMRGI